jgi:hypothetical protein
VSEKAKLQKRHLVQATAERLRDRVLAAEPDAQILHRAAGEVARERRRGRSAPFMGSGAIP